MWDFCLPLFALALVLITLFGCANGFWLILKALFGSNEGPKRLRCQKCGWLSVENGRCTHCGHSPEISLAQRSRDDLQATARQLNRLHRNGQIPYDQCLSLLKLVEADLSRLGSALPQDVWPNWQKLVADRTAGHAARAAAPVEKVEPLIIGDDSLVEIAPEQPQLIAPVVIGDSPPASVAAEPAVGDAVQPIMAEIVAAPVVSSEPNPFAGQFTAPGQTELSLPPATPSRTAADMLQGFMEESNIRWIEVLAGMSIVICAIGLVVSLRHALNIPYFPALLFGIFTVFFHIAGLYTLRYWKLHAVSRAILVIALLLVPLCFSAGMVLSGEGDAQRPLGDPIQMAAVIIGLAVFGWVAYSGSRELVGEGALRLTAAILGCSVGQVVINRGAVEGLARGPMTLLALVPVASFLLAAIGQIWRAQAWKRMSSRRIEQTFLLLGVSLFALLPPLVLLVFKIEPRWPTFKQLSPILSLVATSVLTIGLVVHRRALAEHLAPLRTAGTAIALLGGALLILFWVVAWPQPALMFNVSLLTGVLLLAIAIRTKLPALHAAAVSVLSVAVLIAFCWVTQLVSASAPTGLQWAQAALQGRTSLLLTGVAVIIAGGGVWQFLKQDRRIGIAYLASAAVLSVLGLLIAGWSGFAPLAEPWTGDGDIAGPLFFCYAVALFAIAITVVSEQMLVAAMALLWIALIQLFASNDTFHSILVNLHMIPERPVLVATIIEAAALAIMAFVLSWPSWRLTGDEFLLWKNSERNWQLVLPLSAGAAIAIATATPFIWWVLPGRFGVHAIYATLAAAVWAVICFARRCEKSFAAAQGAAAVAVAFAIAAAWVPATAEKDAIWFLRAEHLQGQLLALAISGVVWSVVRRFARPGSTLHTLLHPTFPPFDHVLLGVAVGLLAVLTFSAALPEISWELGFEKKKLTIEEIAWLDATHPWRLVAGLIAVVVALIAALADRVTGLKLIGLALAGWSGLFLLANEWQAEIAAASAARWWFVIYGILLMAVFVARNPLQRLLATQSWLRWGEFEPPVKEWFRFQPLVLGVLPTLALTVIAVAQHASGVYLRGPAQGSFFEWLGPTASYAGPMLVGVAIFLGLALRERKSAFAFGGGLLFQLAANLAFILHISGQTVVAPGMQGAEWLQWNTLAAASYALLWLGLTHWLTPRESTPTAGHLKEESFFLVHVAVTSWFVLAVAVWAAGSILRFPDALSAESVFLGHWSNVIAAALVVLPLIRTLGVTRSLQTWPLGASGVIVVIAAMLPLVALRYEFFRGTGTWAAYHLLEIGWSILASVVAIGYAWVEWNRVPTADRSEQSRLGIAPHHALGAVLCGLVALFAVRGNFSDPAEPLFSPIVMAGVAVNLILFGLARRSQPYAIASLVAAPLAAALPWFTPTAGLWTITLQHSSFLVAWCSCLLAASVVAGWWQFIEIRTQRRLSQTFSARWFGPLAGHLAIWAVTTLLAIASVAHLLFAGSEWYRSGLPFLDWGLIGLVVVWLVLGATSIGTIWDRRANFIFPVLLIWAWIACALALTPLHEDWLPMLCLHALATATILGIAGHLWSYGVNLASWGESLGVSDTIGGLTRIERWLPTLTLLLGIAICGLELAGMWNLELREYRVAIAFAPAAIAYALACQAQQRREQTFRLSALLLSGLSCVYLGWSDLNPGWELDDWMTRAFRLLMVLAVTTLAYGLVLPRFIFRAASWLQATQQAGAVSAVLAITTLLSLLALEVSLFRPGVGADVEPIQVAAVAVLLVFFIIGLISLALAPGAADPAQQKQRTWFVYGAQVVAGLLFGHLYLCQPGWFDGVLKPYWPYIIMAIAFSGVGLGELFWRLRLPILAEPFQRTGSFLPVLPILGLWVIQSKHDFDYTMLLFLAGLMYLLMSILRKSWAAAAAAAVAGNGSFWSLLKQSHWSALENPQFWLIPPAVSVLTAAHINRHRLKPEMLSAIRYGSLIVIYVSSTFEIFLHRAETSLWPPIILAILSVSGALAGVLLQIRAFLYLGSVFTLLALVSMVWHAARAIEQVWPWWLFGFGMGIVILAGLAFFEKNKPQVQALVARLRQWEK